MPQNRISISTSGSVSSRRAIVVEASGDAGLIMEKPFLLCTWQLESFDLRKYMRNTPLFMLKAPIVVSEADRG